MRDRPVWLWLAVGLLAFTACADVHRREASWGGEVAAPTAAEADALLDLIEVSLPAVQTLVPSVRPPRVAEVRHERRRSEVLGWAASDEGLIVVHVLDTEVVGHELVHLMGESMDVLPGVLEEGLATWVGAGGCVPEARAWHIRSELVQLLFHEVARELGAVVSIGGLPDDAFDPVASLETRVYDDISPRDRIYGTLLADAIMRRRGMAWLEERARETRDAGLDVIPAEVLLEGAGIDGSLASQVTLLAVAAPHLRDPRTFFTVHVTEDGHVRQSMDLTHLRDL